MTFDRVEVLRETPRAILLWFDDYRMEHWIPKSQLHAGSVNALGASGTLVVSAWYGRKLKEDLKVQEESAVSTAYERGLREGFAMGSAQQVDALQIKAIYRKLVAKYHPDRRGGDAEVMKDINELWQATKIK